MAGGIAKGVVGGTPINEGTTFFSFQVEKQVDDGARAISRRTTPTCSDRRTSKARSSRQFVVDTNGRADMSTFKVIKSTHDLFMQAVKNALRDYRFYPAEIGGHKVKQLVQQPFQFTLNTH